MSPKLTLRRAQRSQPEEKIDGREGGGQQKRLKDKAAFLDFVVRVPLGIRNELDLKVLPRRWVVERTFGRLTRRRRLVRDYEQRIDVSKAMIHVAMASVLLRQISH